jgi:DNA ligase-1
VFNIFDIYLQDKILDERISILNSGFKQYKLDENYVKGIITRVKNHYCDSLEDLEKFYKKTIKNGNEGIVIRQLSRNGKFDKKSLYMKGKNQNLLKLKPVFDAEGIITEITAGQGKFSECAMFKLKFVNPQGQTVYFDCSSHGPLEDRKKYLDKPKKYIGRIYTFKFGGYSDYGIPFEPRGVAFREDIEM